MTKKKTECPTCKTKFETKNYFQPKKLIPCCNNCKFYYEVGESEFPCFCCTK